MARIKVQSACRDCAMCTGHAFTGVGRSIGRGALDVATLGVSHLARRNCKLCGHPMAEHQSQAAQPVVIVNASGSQQPLGTTEAAAGYWVKQDDGRHRWWNGERWTDYYTNYPNDPIAVNKALAALSHNPPRWIEQEDGRQRWWAGLEWADEWRDAPKAVEASASTSPSGSSAAEEIRKLADLRDAGILTDEEFVAAKAKLLGI